MHDLRLLIVNADDFGLTKDTSAAILDAHDRGIVTSTSVLALGRGATASVGSLRSSAIGVGTHLALVGEDPPLLTAAEIPSLVDRRGRLAHSWRVLVPRLMARRVDPGDIRAELSAQIALVRTEAGRVTHLDTHQHLHLWPAVGSVVLDLAADHDIPAVRVPWSATPGAKGRGIRRLARRLRVAAARRGLCVPEGAAGLDGAGAMDEERLCATIRALGSSGCATAEIGTHPGAIRDPDRDAYRWGYRWGEELAALTSTGARATVAEAGFQLGTYADLASAQGRM